MIIQSSLFDTFIFTFFELSNLYCRLVIKITPNLWQKNVNMQFITIFGKADIPIRRNYQAYLLVPQTILLIRILSSHKCILTYDVGTLVIMHWMNCVNKHIRFRKYNYIEEVDKVEIDKKNSFTFIKYVSAQIQNPDATYTSIWV